MMMPTWYTSAWTDYYLEPLSKFIMPAPKQEEHLILQVGDVIKIKKEKPLFTIPAEMPLTVVAILEGDQYVIDWSGKEPGRICVLMQDGVDLYVKKLMR
jgi:hypothetical protein